VTFLIQSQLKQGYNLSQRKLKQTKTTTTTEATATKRSTPLTAEMVEVLARRHFKSISVHLIG
jgi:hypothetical protein